MTTKQKRAAITSTIRYASFGRRVALSHAAHPPLGHKTANGKRADYLPRHIMDKLLRRVNFEVLTSRSLFRLRGPRKEIRFPRTQKLESEVVLASRLGLGNGMPERLRRGLDVDFENFLHGLVFQRYLRPGRAASQGSVYLLTQRSWMSRMERH